jgi:hypothetical protein
MPVRFARSADTDRWRVQVLAANRRVPQSGTTADGTRSEHRAGIAILMARVRPEMARLYRAVGAEAMPDQAALAAGA